MEKPRIFLGSSGQQEKLLQALTRGLEDVARYWSEAVKEGKDGSGVFYYWKGERPLDPNAPQLDGTGEIRLESADRASGYFTTHAETHPRVNTRTAGVYLRADPADMSILDGLDDRKRAELIAERMRNWKSIKNA